MDDPPVRRWVSCLVLLLGGVLLWLALIALWDLLIGLPTW